jgi:hypothetical protein
MIVIPSFCYANNESQLKEKSENNKEQSATLIEEILEKYPIFSRICCLCYVRRRQSVGIDSNCNDIKALSLDIGDPDTINCQNVEYTTVEM